MASPPLSRQDPLDRYITMTEDLVKRLYAELSFEEASAILRVVAVPPPQRNSIEVRVQQRYATLRRRSVRHTEMTEEETAP